MQQASDQYHSTKEVNYILTQTPRGGWKVFIEEVGDTP